MDTIPFQFMKVPVYIFFMLIFPLLTSQAQDRFSQGLIHFQLEQPNEKVYLHLDKPYYSAGENIWIKAYITDATFHRPTYVSSTLYVELLDSNQSMVDSIKLRINEGTSQGSLRLSRKLQTGSYRIRAYTKWMRNADGDFFFRKDFTLVNPEFKPDSSSLNSSETTDQLLYVSFMPEGGDLIDGIPTKVAIKITDRYGKGIPETGVISDQDGNALARFECNKFGHGVFLLIPKYGISYSAKVRVQEFALPETRKSGASLKVDHKFQSDRIIVGVLSQGLDLRGGTLVAHQRGNYLFSKKCADPTSFTVTLDESQLGAGLVHFTFFDKNDVPLTERLMFTNIPSADSSIAIQPGQKSYTKRAEITLDFECLEDSVQSASVTIAPKEEVNYTADNENIVNYLLLSADLKGRIESPGYYFSGSLEAFNDLNLLMLTQGWSRFNWKELLHTEKKIPMYQAEKGIYMRGQVIDYYNEKPREAEISLTIPSLGIFESTGQTDSLGNFIISVEEFIDSTQVFIKAFSYKGKRKRYYEDVKIRLDYLPKPEIQFSFQPKLPVSDTFMKKAELLNQIEKAYFLNPETILLDEVVVSAEKYDDEENPRTNYYDSPSNRLILDSLGFDISGQNILDLLRRIPGVLVSGNGVSVQGSTRLSESPEPLFILDDIPVDFEMIEFIPAVDIDFIDVLKGAEASVFGSRGGNGIILIYTRKGYYTSDEKAIKGLLAFKYLGYQGIKEFYSPDYSVPDERHIVPDYRSTLYWNPNVIFKDGKAQVSFYSSDQEGTFEIRMEGILRNGKPFIQTGFFTVEN